jgi:hypothetical protein
MAANWENHWKRSWEWSIWGVLLRCLGTVDAVWVVGLLFFDITARIDHHDELARRSGSIERITVFCALE